MDLPRHTTPPAFAPRSVPAAAEEQLSAAVEALTDADVTLLVGHGALAARGEHIGRRTTVSHALVGDASATLRTLLPRLARRQDRSHLDKATKAFRDWHERQQSLLDHDHDRSLVGKVRAVFDNPSVVVASAGPDERIRPEAVAAAIDRLAPESAIFTSDTGMSTAWLARYVAMRGTRRLVGSYNLGSMANAMPMVLESRLG
jgi:pyruvate dehydrogenase (quinone)